MIKSLEYSLFYQERINLAIERIKKFARLSEAMGYDVRVGFSGGKDSQVVYDLCKKSGIKFTAFYNVACESSETRRFIREHYPDVIWRQPYKIGFIMNIDVHKGLLPTVQIAYCCENYKHNPKFVDNASVVGVRRAESAARRGRQVFESHGKRFDKAHNTQIAEFFSEKCRGIGSAGDIQLKPIVDWTDEEVWEYIKREHLPVNPEYRHSRRVGCMICPKANLTSNYYHLMQHPKLIDAVIRQRDKHADNVDWSITSEGKDYRDNKPLYILRWLNHSFMPFTKKQEKLAEAILKRYKNAKLQNNNGRGVQGT
ncbi:MAG: phosphoadenosine phosphosulfate reductase family protein [Bacteroidaceae bacterium]|nr:phosphoadenosine phosphosulfate reductase family protein [Bacteroidaceae bacterium]